MTQSFPNAPMPADDFLISDDTDLDAASQWLLGLDSQTPEPLSTESDTKPEERLPESLLLDDDILIDDTIGLDNTLLGLLDDGLTPIGDAPSRDVLPFPQRTDTKTGFSDPSLKDVLLDDDVSLEPFLEEHPDILLDDDEPLASASVRHDVFHSSAILSDEPPPQPALPLKPTLLPAPALATMEVSYYTEPTQQAVLSDAIPMPSIRPPAPAGQDVLAPDVFQEVHPAILLDDEPVPELEGWYLPEPQPVIVSAPAYAMPEQSYAAPVQPVPKPAYVAPPATPIQQPVYSPPSQMDYVAAQMLPDEPVQSRFQHQGEAATYLTPKRLVEIANPQSLWEEVLERLKSQMTKPSFETWIAPLQLTGVSDDRVTLAVDSEFNRDWVLKKYRALLTEAFSSRLERMVMIHLDVDESLHQAQSEAAYPNYAEPSASEPVKPKPAKKQSVWTPRTAQSNLNPKYTFDNFIVGQGNRFCHAAALAVAETPAQSYNPFFIYGGVGLGKTHIMQAIAHFAHQHHPEMAVRYVTAEQFTNELINAITGKTMKAFRDRYRKNDILIIDDIQFLEGKERTQEEIFHTFNALHQAGKQIILSSDRAPRYLSQLEDRLKSRFEWGLITDIQPADFETRLAILKSKVKRDHFHVPDDVLVYIAESYPNNIRELEGALNKVTAYAMLTKTILDLPTAKHLLGAGQPESAQISKEKIIEIVAEYYHLSAADLKSPSRAKDVSHARQVSIYVLRHLTEASFPKIGELLGGRKHTTILYAYEKMKEELERHPNLAHQVQEITGRVKSPK